MTDYKQLCIELINELHGYKVAHPQHDTELIERARARVAEPEPEGPTYDDLAELCSRHGLDADSWPLEKFDALWEIARAVLARWGK